MVHREPLPIIPLTQIGEETGGVLVKMQEGPTLGVENPELFLDKDRAAPQVLDHIAKCLKGAHIGVFHCEGL